MATPPIPRLPGQITVEPRGRPVQAIIGAIIIAAGLVLGSILTVNNITISGPAVSSPLATATPLAGLTPNGNKPAQFLTYQDPQQRYALYYSPTWNYQPTTLTLAGQSTPALTFAPNPAGTKLPQWIIGITAQPLPTDLIGVVNGVLQMQGGNDFMPTNGPIATTVGAYDWTRLDGTVTISGQSQHISSFIRKFGSGSLFIMEAGLAFMFDTTDKQNFTPMLASLVLKDAQLS